MLLYSLLDHVLPRSYVAKVVGVAVVFGQGPLLALVIANAYGAIPPDSLSLAIAAVLCVSLPGLALSLSAVISPVKRLEAAFTAFEAGASDSAALPQHHRDAVGRLMAQAGRMMRTAETRIDAAQKLADLDPLTGLLNRRGLERSLANRQEPGERGAVLMMDCDHFKRVNDLHGHDAGDRVLRDLARLLRRHMRRPDLAARFGGEEFVLYLSGISQDAAIRVAERLRLAVADAICVGGVAQTVSIGVAPWPPGQSFEAILKRADMAVYAAKAEGRNRVHLVPAARVVARPAPTPEARESTQAAGDTGGPRSTAAIAVPAHPCGVA